MGAISLLQRGKSGIFISFVVLTPVTLFSVFYAVRWLLNTSTIVPDLGGFSITVAFLISNIIMSFFLVKGWKSVHWKQI
jgi:hypothetical protein